MSKLVLNKYSPDKKDFSVLLSFLIWLFIGFLIFFVGVNNIFAATYTVDNFTAQIYDNVNGTLTAKSTSKETDFYYSLNVNYAANSSGGAWGISSPIPLVANHTYSMTVDPQVIGCGFTILSTVNRLGVGTTLANAVTSYQNNTNVNEKFSQSISNSRYLQFVFTPTINSSYIIFPFSTTSSCSGRESQLSNVVIEDLGETGISQGDINNSLNNQTNELNNSIQNSTDTITGEIDDMEQSIIDSNKETQDVIKDQFNTCRPSTNLLNLILGDNTKGLSVIIDENNVITLNGTATSNGSIYISNNTTLLGNEYYTLSSQYISGTSNQNNATIGYWNNLSSSFYFIGSVGNKLTSIYDSDLSSRFLIYVETGYTFENYKFKVWLNKGSISQPYEPFGEEICNNKIDETNDKLDDLNNNITNDNINDNNISNAFNNFENFIDENATISSLITLPVTLFSAILNGLQSSCVPFNLGSLYGEDLILPCINISSYLGSTLWTMIDVIISGFAIYFISKKFIKVFNNFSSMKEGDVIDD